MSQHSNCIRNLSQVWYVNLCISQYIFLCRIFVTEQPDMDPANILPDGRFNHVQQVQERLRFLRFLLKDGQLWLCEPQAKQIWTCLAENAIYVPDRENCFKWFSKVCTYCRSIHKCYLHVQSP